MTDTTTLDTLQGHHELTIDALARVILSTLIEPGDASLGYLVSTIGAADAVRTLLDGEGGSVSDELRQRARQRFSPSAIEQALRSADRVEATLVTPEHPHWPTRVDDLGPNAPIALWVRGNTELLTDELMTGVVGARASSGYGEHVTMELVAGLVDRGHTIASGAAYGIDGIAHRAALASKGRTVAYLAGGVDRFYPAGHDALLGRIVEQGAVVSELPCGAQPSRWRFLARNRLIAANSTSVLVTEAGWRSGALSTVGHAVTLGRPVGAVPGPITSAASAGTHRIIREKLGTLVTNADDVAAL